jgi:hypothetical protein
VTTVNGPDTQEVTPVISWDRQMLFFGSLRPGSAAADIYVAVRTKEDGPL